MIGKKTEKILNRAVEYAIENGQQYFTLEHVFWSLLQDPVVAEVVRACGGEPVRLSGELDQYLRREIPSERASDRPETGEDSETGVPRELDEPPFATPAIQRLLQRALFQVQSSGKDEIQPEDLFVAIFGAKDSHSLYLLESAQIERLEVIRYLSHGRDHALTPAEGRSLEGASGENPQGEGSEGRGDSENGASGNDPLAAYTIPLNEWARAGKIDPLIGRTVELERVVQALCRRRKNNPLLVGEAGVGKTAIAEGLALKIVRGEVPSLLAEAEIYSLDLGALLAGARFRGDFEQRLKKVLAALDKKKSQGKLPILFVDEIHTIIGAGAVSGGSLDAANILKPILVRGEIRCIGSTTYGEYRSVFEKDHALARRFQKIDISEPTQEEAIRILEGVKSGFEKHHGVVYTSAALRSAVELSVKHLTDRQLPDKAIDVLDEAGAKARLTNPSGTHPKAPLEIGHDQIEAVIAQIARIPARSVSTSQKDRLQKLEGELKLAIFGQDAAIQALVSAIRMARSGLRTGDRPVGSFLFCGPTGVGKTELSKQLAAAMGVPFQRFDMSEYGEKHTVSRLIGAPPGYVGFDQPGLLTEALIKNPHSVVLLDEVEKAHADIWNILLQVMDHGALTDNNGRKADFRNAILIMTSNVGSRDLERKPLGIISTHHLGKAAQKAVEQTFTPEFRNRLDAVVFFNPLDPLTIAQVVGKQLMELENLLLAKSVELDVDPEVREWLAQKGYDPLLGARPMARLIQDKLKRQLADQLLFGALENGGKVEIKMKDGEPQFEYLPPKKSRAKSIKKTSVRAKRHEPV